MLCVALLASVQYVFFVCMCANLYVLCVDLYEVCVYLCLLCVDLFVLCFDLYDVCVYLCVLCVDLYVLCVYHDKQQSFPYTLQCSANGLSIRIILWSL